MINNNKIIIIIIIIIIVIIIRCIIIIDFIIMIFIATSYFITYSQMTSKRLWRSSCCLGMLQVNVKHFLKT